MLRLTVFEFIVRGIPEAFALVLLMTALSNTKLNAKRYIISSLLLGIGEYGIRILPINFGVHTILAIFVMIVLMRNISGMDIVWAIKSSLIATIGLFIIEGLNILALKLIIKDAFETIMSNTILKTICGLPSLICITIIAIICYLKRKNI